MFKNRLSCALAFGTVLAGPALRTALAQSSGGHPTPINQFFCEGVFTPPANPAYAGDPGDCYPATRDLNYGPWALSPYRQQLDLPHSDDGCGGLAARPASRLFPAVLERQLDVHNAYPTERVIDNADWNFWAAAWVHWNNGVHSGPLVEFDYGYAESFDLK